MDMYKESTLSADMQRNIIWDWQTTVCKVVLNTDRMGEIVTPSSR